MMSDTTPKSEPLVFMWMAHFNNGQVLPQFDFETGHENLYSLIKQYAQQQNALLTKLGWYPLSPALTEKIVTVESEARPLPSFELVLDPQMHETIFRRTELKYGLDGLGSRISKRIYVLGFEKNNEYSLMFIDAFGNCELSAEYNYK